MAQLKSGTTIWGDGVVQSNLNVGGALYDSADTSSNSYIKPSGTSKITTLVARGTELVPGNEAGGGAGAGTISVSRRSITVANSATFYGLYNATSGVTTPYAGIGIDSLGNLWFGKLWYNTVTASYTRKSDLFYSDTNGNFNATGHIIAGGTFRSKGSYTAADNTSLYLDLTTTATNHTILSTGVSTDTMGYNPLWGVYLGGTDNRYISNGTTSTGPLYIFNGNIYPMLTAYNAITVETSSTFTNPVVIKLNNDDNTGTTATTHLTLVNQTGGSSGIYWRFGNSNSVVGSIRANSLGDIIYNSKRGNYKFQSDFGPYTTNFYNSSTIFMTVDSDSIVNFPKNIYAPKLIDSDNNNYYVDPGTTSTMNQLTLSGTFDVDVITARSTVGNTYISASRPLISTGEVGYKWITNTSTIWKNYIPKNADTSLVWALNGVNQYIMSVGGTLAAVNPVSAAIQAITFADVGNTAYYVKPSDYSYINSLVLGGAVTSISTATGLKIVTPNSDPYYNTLFWNNWNWQTDVNNSAALWSNTTTRVLTITGNGNWGFNQITIPSDLGMLGGIVVNGTGTNQVAVMKGNTSGFAIRVSDAVFGDFSLYDKAYASATVWRRSINSREGTVGINALANTTYGLTVGGGISANKLVSDFDTAYTINFTGTSVLSSLNAVQYGWYLNTGTGLALLDNTFETSAIFGSDKVLGSGSLVDLLLWNFPDTVETYNVVSTVWTVDSTTDVRSLFTSQNSLNSAVAANYTLPLGASKQRIRFTWNGFSNRTWDALFITGVSGSTPLSITIESAAAAGGPWTTHVNNVSIGTTTNSGFHYIRTQGTTVGAYFRLTIAGNGTSAVNFYNISLLGSRAGGTTGFANRLLNWDVSKNITTYGNITTKIVYDAASAAYYLSPAYTSNLNTGTFVGDVLTQGQGRFTGWKDAPATTSTRYWGMGVEVGTAGTGINQAGYIYSITRFPNGTSANAPLYTFGSTISLSPSTGALYLSGTWYDGDNVFYYVKPGTGSVLSNLKAFGMVQFVNTGGNNYNENIRLPRAANGLAGIYLGTDQSGSGSITSQWNIQATALPTGQLTISNTTGTAVSISLSTNDVTFGNNTFAKKYYGNPSDAFNYYYLYPPGQSYLNALKVGASTTTNYDVLTLGPDDVTSPFLSYAHTNIGNIDTGFNLSASTVLPNYSYVGSLQVTANAPTYATGQGSPTAVNNTWYTLYQARHRGGYAGSGDGYQYGSQIIIPMTGSSANFSRMFFRGQGTISGIGGSWSPWAEVFTAGSVNYSHQYTVYFKQLIDPIDSAYTLALSTSSYFNNIKVGNGITGYLTGTPVTGTTKEPNSLRFGSSEWVLPNTDGTGIIAEGTRAAYRQGLYNWYSTANTSANTPSAAGNAYYAGIGFGQGTSGSVEIAGRWIPASDGAAIPTYYSVGLFFRTLRDTSSGWARWSRILDAYTYKYAANMDQDVTTTSSPTFADLTITNDTLTFKRVTAKSYWTDAQSSTNMITARFIMPWYTVTAGGAAAGGAGGFGPFSDGSAATTLATNWPMGFRFDEVSSTPVGTPTFGQNAYNNNAYINLWVGPNRIVGNSGTALYAGGLGSNVDAAYYLIPSATSKLNTVSANTKFEVTGVGRYEFPNSRGLMGIDQPNVASGTTNADGGFINKVYGIVATYGYGSEVNIGGTFKKFAGYSISAQSGTISAQFIKQKDSNKFGLHSSSATDGGGTQKWWLVANGNKDSPKMILNCQDDLNVDQYFGIGATAMSYGVYVNGSLASNDNVYAYSDRRKKRDIFTIENALDKLLKLRGVTYYRIDAQPEDVGCRQVGVIAQEVQEIFPEVVKSSGENQDLSVAYGNMAGIFIEAIKDLKKELDELKTELNMLKGNK